MHCQNKIAKAFDNYLAKEGCLEDFFKKKNSGTINPVYLPKQLLNNTKKVPTKHCLSQILPNIFILQLMRNIPLTTMTLIVFCFGKSALERNAAMFILWTWGKMSLKGIFFSNFGNLYMLQNNLLLNRGLLTGAVLAKLPDPNGFGLGFSSTLQGARRESYMVLANSSENSINIQV